MLKKNQALSYELEFAESQEFVNSRFQARFFDHNELSNLLYDADVSCEKFYSIFGEID